MPATNHAPPRTPTRYPPSIKLERTKIPWGTPEERQQEVKALHSKGYQLKLVASRLSVNVQTVRRDKRKLCLDTWSKLTDAELSSHVAASIALGHTAVGIQKIDGYLLKLGFRVQEHRIKATLVCLATVSFSITFLNTCFAMVLGAVHHTICIYHFVWPCSLASRVRSTTLDTCEGRSPS